MSWVAGGMFQMGSNNGYSNEKPVHTVTLSGFYIGRIEVTQAQYEDVMGSNPSNFTNANGEIPDSGEVDSNRPVEQVSWYDALVFCNTLSITEGLTPAFSIGGSTNPADWGSVPSSSDSKWNTVTVDWSANGYRLPTEAEWEYAARGRNGSPDSYAGSGTMDNVAWYDENGNDKTHEVGKKAPNNLELYDMLGNIWEWCWDWFGSGYYNDTTATDPNPVGASSGSDRVFRGGGWTTPVGNVRSALRTCGDPSYRHFALGFRLVRPQF